MKQKLNPDNEVKMSSSLYQLAYVSCSVSCMTEWELQVLLKNARRNNHRLGVTGMLLYSDGAFMQVLEGERQAVLDLYKQILKDRRHLNAMVIHKGPIEYRHFADWKMGFRYLNKELFERQPGFTDVLRQGSPAAEALKKKPDASYQLLLSFSHCSAVVPQLEQL